MKSNILFLSIDSLRVDQIYGKNKSAKIPNIEKLINSGIFFEQVISTSDATGLSLGSIFTSMYPFKSGITHFKFNSELSNCFDVFRENGYTLFSTVPDVSFFLKLTANFDHNHHYVYDKRENWKQLAGGIGEKIIEDLKSKEKSHPWFYFIHLMDLHRPFYLPDEHNKEEYGESRYDRMISYIDTWIGKFLEKIDLENTIFVFTSDHGDYIPILDEDLNAAKIPSLLKKSKKFIPVSLSHPILAKIQSTKRSRSLKKLEKELSYNEIRTLRDRGEEFLFDELLRIPLIFCGNNVSKNLKINNQVRQTDIIPTLFGLIGIKNVLDSIDGRSLIPLINNNSLIEEPAYIETGSRTAKDMGKIIGIRTTNYKYLRSRNDLTKNVTLYNLKNDPGETKNIANSNKQIVNDMEYTLQKIRGDYAMDSPIEMTKEENEKIEKELRKLGYME
tara:strand:+ start:1927 stop:3261 length:1335 start_codon:yes stop_codon:yes gene_type:complete